MDTVFCSFTFLWSSESFGFQGDDDDRMWLVSYHQALGGAEQGERQKNGINELLFGGFFIIKINILFVFQVALSVAAEFWEQGDLERTVLEQQPIVSLQIVVVNVFS